ncbi:MAG: alpha/beta hydrolase, partial [Janthinobacterium lividum]
NAASFGGDPSRVFLAGHSSGAHLAAVLLTTDWHARGLSATPVRGALLMSGTYDLYPVMLSSRRSYLRATQEEVAALSPLRHLDRLPCPVTVTWADQDSPEFKRQSDVFATALQGMGLLAGRHVLFNTSHFEEPEQLNRPDTLLGGVALTMMGLT